MVELGARLIRKVHHIVTIRSCHDRCIVVFSEEASISIEVDPRIVRGLVGRISLIIEGRVNVRS